MGQQVSVSGLTATFVGVSDDSRCPLNAICVANIWAGGATLQFDLSANRRAARYNLTLYGLNRRPTTYQGFVIEVQDLQPYPFAGRPTPQRTPGNRENQPVDDRAETENWKLKAGSRKPEAEPTLLQPPYRNL